MNIDIESKFSLLSILNELGFAKEVCVLALHQLEAGASGVGQAVVNALAMIEAQQKAAEANARAAQLQTESTPIAPDAVTPPKEQLADKREVVV
jgi:hypothetical protein